MRSKSFDLVNDGAGLVKRSATIWRIWILKARTVEGDEQVLTGSWMTAGHGSFTTALESTPPIECAWRVRRRPRVADDSAGAAR